MRTILGVNLVYLLAATAFAQDRNFPAALGTGLPPMNLSDRPPGLNYSGFPIGDGYDYGFGGYGYAAPYPNAPRVAHCRDGIPRTTQAAGWPMSVSRPSTIRKSASAMTREFS